MRRYIGRNKQTMPQGSAAAGNERSKSMTVDGFRQDAFQNKRMARLNISRGKKILDSTPHTFFS